ncbi:hypothetical protein DSUL_20583 [Desulfovibrionales bacterium]
MTKNLSLDRMQNTASGDMNIQPAGHDANNAGNALPKQQLKGFAHPKNNLFEKTWGISVQTNSVV